VLYTDLKPGTCIILDGQPCVVLEYEFLRMQQRKPVVKTKLRNLISGSISEHSWQPSDDIKEAEIERQKSQFLYSHKGEFWFTEANNPKNRFSLKEEFIGSTKDFLKSNLEVVAIKFLDPEGKQASNGAGKIIGIEIPIKVDYKVVEAPPAIKGNTAQGGTKTVVIETGIRVATPLFINEGDIVRVNTSTGQYTERVEKR